jgi:3-methyladenine DNA glycosylase/8-oxoguanine DNA glycosylase
MHLYLRVLLDNGPETYSSAEEQHLRDCVASAPGVEKVKDVTRHVKGGYSVTLSRSGSTDEEIISRLTSFGYRIVF